MNAACINASKNLKMLLKSAKSKTADSKGESKNLHLYFTGKNHKEIVNGTPQFSSAVDVFCNWPSAEICTNNEKETLVVFKHHFNICGSPKNN